MRLSRYLAVALFVAGVVVVVEAQQPRPFGGGFGGINAVNAVLTNKDLQAELKVTDAQKEKFKDPSEKLAALNKKRGEAFKGAGGDKEKLKDIQADFAKESETVNDEIKKVVAEVLTPEQNKRLKQIDLQAKGLRAFTNEDVAKELKITDGQSSKIKGIVEEYNKDSQGLGGGGGGKGGFDKTKAAENQAKREKLTKAAMADIDEALTADQKKHWKEMTGEPFDTAKLRPGGGGFGKNKTKD